MNRYLLPLKYLVYSDSHLNFEFEGKIKFIAVTLSLALIQKQTQHFCKFLSPGVSGRIRTLYLKDCGLSVLPLKQGANVIKLFYGRKLRIFVISQSVWPWQAFPAQSFVLDKARSQPYSGASERFSNWDMLLLYQ